ncbi:putative sterol dehydrogenase [Flammula alnicola]|nr:putative sterol dehydrogenase [Flammula alnicola]
MSNQERYLVIGGSGFLGSYIAQALVDRRERFVAAYDLAKPAKADIIDGVEYFCGDILNEKQLLDCLKLTNATTVFHTVSPVHGLKEAVYYRVNVEGTRTILSACQTVRVKIFVFTSSSSIVSTGDDISGSSEKEAIIPEYIYEAYTHTKGIAEKMALEANGSNAMRVVALRPCGMVGPRDRQAMWRLAEAYQKGQHKYQMGNNTNLVDYCYVGNVADAHLLAADHLSASASSPSDDQVSGEVFFITDGKPRPYWDFPRTVFKQLGDDGKGVVSLPRWLCVILAFFSELWASIFGGLPAFPMFIVKIATQEQWYNIDKARNLLGYEPRVSLEEGARLMVEWWKERGEKEHIEMTESRKLR